MRSSGNVKPPNLTEGQIVSALCEFLKSENYRVRKEVPNLGQSADLVATRGRWVTMIEVKVHDWRTALRQCQTHEHVADFVCVALGSAHVSILALDAIEERGYGLIHWQDNGGFRWVLKPVRNELSWKPTRKAFSSNLKRIEYVV